MYPILYTEIIFFRIPGEDDDWNDDLDDVDNDSSEDFKISGSTTRRKSRQVSSSSKFPSYSVMILRIRIYIGI